MYSTHLAYTTRHERVSRPQKKGGFEMPRESYRLTIFTTSLSLLVLFQFRADKHPANTRPGPGLPQPETDCKSTLSIIFTCTPRAP